MGSHSKPKGREDYQHSKALTRAGTEQPWTRRYPAITLAALAGTVVGAPGGVAAAMAFSGSASDAVSEGTSVVAAAPAMPLAPLMAAAPASPSPSASASAKPSPKATKTAPPSPYAHTTLAQLEPTSIYGAQSTFTPSATQWANARAIVKVAEQRKMPLYAAVVATATAIQESQLINLTEATNADSLGLFQQRPSQGWGTAAQITDPYYATNAFLAALDVYAPHYMTIYLWQAAQAVQRSGFPTAYAQWETQAARMVLAIVNGTAPH
ncbi:hypothetical protein KGA66_22055 [Actinocrinis puniceicyclus]|uniref:Uncharacterized protein n=1 Tax=Actinocrinis puniceicyclus TaxID=977794 RepID=A0A8J8BD27_9ACTN|nr:hypothetical protein [Actinocrinis puniceicyclus]MBS2965752.1 hypothetical protein [Actinocrinis puniceicyclus]